jgi:hypothetical protein
MSSEKPNNLPEEAVELFDVYDQYQSRLIDKDFNQNRHYGRFKKRDIAEQLLKAKNSADPSNPRTYISPFWGVVVSGVGYSISQNTVRQPVMTSARAAVIAQIAPEERKLMNLVEPRPDVCDSRIATMYDLLVYHPAYGYDVLVGRFADRSEAEKFAQVRAQSRFSINEVMCFVSGDTAYAVGTADQYPIVSSPAEALIGMIAPEFRALLDL